MLSDLAGFHRKGALYVHDEEEEFSYSDGDDVEQYLRSVMKNAADLSSYSPELETAIRDWPTEYHLSSRRANLLRAFDLTNCRKVLELGCGCGAITRFLGEQGLSVHAVEGSALRAEIAALRCRDLENVTVYCGNFNKMELPERRYDLICLVGVAEYAARFMEDEGPGVQPVVRLLDSLRGALSPGGVVLLAIENRTGMKYVLGAREDHYSKPLIGLNDYFGIRDVNTYTLVEWERMFQQLGVEHKRLYLPFPDYKLPTALLSQEFVTDNPYAYCNLEGIQSRDYVDMFKPQVRESLFWQSAAASNSMDVHSNSFLFVFSMSDTGVGDGFKLDFARLPEFKRRRRYCVLAVKPEGRAVVERRSLMAQSGRDADIGHRVVTEPYYRGTLLSVLWSRALEIEPDGDRFPDLVREYIRYLQKRNELSIDLTASNIIVDEAGALRAFDEEWVTAEPVSVDFLLFRSLLIFVLTLQDAVRRYARSRSLGTVGEFMGHVGGMVDVDLAGRMDEFAEREERFQNAIGQSRAENQTRLLLDTSLAEEATLIQPLKARLYWRKRGEAYTEDSCRWTLIENTDETTSVTIALPPAAGRANQIRFNPCEGRTDGIGFLYLSSIEISAVDPGAKTRTSVWAMTSGDEIARYASMAGMSYTNTGLGWLFMVSGDDPWLELRFIPRVQLPGDQYLEFTARLRYPRSREYLLARDRYLGSLERLDRQSRDIDELRESHERIEKELAAIKGSAFWNMVTRYRTYRRNAKSLADKLGYWHYLLHHLGARRTLARARRRAGRYFRTLVGVTPEIIGPPTRYEVWRETRLNRQVRPLPAGPLISVIMPVHNVDGRVLKKAIRSVERQTYGNWELCIADDASTNKETLEVLDKAGGRRIKVTRLPENRNISAATNAAVRLARGEYLAFMDNDDELADNALYEVASKALEEDPDCMYTDEDFIRLDNHLDFPHFKPDYSPDLLLSHNYITHLLVVKTELFEAVGGLRSEYDGAQDYDLALRIVERARKIVHIPKPLYHWRMSESSTSLNPTVKPGSHGNAKKALEAALERRGIRGTVEETRLPHFFRVRREIAGKPLVSIIIPFRDKPDLLRQCVTSVLERSTWSALEVVGISNESSRPATYDEMARLKTLDERVAFRELDIEFNFSKLVNFGVRQANGEHVILLNNDVEILTPDWIEGLLEHSQRPDVAAVGGKLYYSDNTIQHAGIAVGLGGYAGHLHKHVRADSPGYFNRLNVIQNISAVTGALMMVEKKKFVGLGGFDESEFGVAYNDVDFCLRARGAGYLNVFTPHVEAYHHESVSRGYEDDFKKIRRFNREKENLRTRHREALERGDPYYNPNLDLNRDDFRLPAV